MSTIDLPSLPSLSSTNSITESPESSLPGLPEVPATSEKSLLPSSDLSAIVSAASTLAQDLNTSGQAISAGDISLSQLDILGNDFKLDGYKPELFNESSVSAVPAPVDLVASRPIVDTSANSQIGSSHVDKHSSVDYQAPWIVTVSMFWNDLPAIMISNQPFVRLVDIHKQILPAKDTGILKKRCQLMGISVENCSEMQRYFIVQYGRAVNSKSTLIISQENAKDLIGYYVSPQPKTSHPSDHKSIIDHRREQLRRIALARRAAMKAQKSADKKDDPRAIREHKDSSSTER